MKDNLLGPYGSSLKNLNPRNRSNFKWTMLRLSTTFHNNFSFRLSTYRFDSLANVCGYLRIAGVQSIQICPSSRTPAAPAISPLGTLKYTESHVSTAEGNITIGSCP